MLFLDLDGTLLDDDVTVRGAVEVFHDAFRTELTEELEPFQLRWRALLEMWFDRYLTGEVTMQGQRRARIHELFPGLTDEEADRRFDVYVAAYESRFFLFDDVLPTLDVLRDRPVGIITNGPVVQQHGKLERAGIKGRFAPIVVSEEVGAAKPSARIFAEAAARAGVPAAACTYVGDRLETDALGAAAAGWRGIWLQRDARVSVDRRIETIRSLAELPGMLLTRRQ